MKVLTLINLYCHWNKYIIINDNKLNRLYDEKKKIFEFMDERNAHKDLLGKEVVSFGLYDDDFCVRVK